MRTDPPFNIDLPENQLELKSIEKGNKLDNNRSNEGEDFSEDKEERKDKKSLPPDPFGNKGNNVDILA